MSITLYSKYRRKNMRNAWVLSGMDKYVADFSVRLAQVAIVVITVLALLGMADDWQESKAAPHKEVAEKAEKVLLACLNGKTVSMNGQLHICSVTNIGERL